LLLRALLLKPLGNRAQVLDLLRPARDDLTPAICETHARRAPVLAFTHHKPARLKPPNRARSICAFRRALAAPDDLTAPSARVCASCKIAFCNRLRLSSITHPAIFALNCTMRDLVLFVAKRLTARWHAL
jgi:hypothetical protein